MAIYNEQGGGSIFFFFDKEPFVTVIRDIRDSKNLESRKDTQKNVVIRNGITQSSVNKMLTKGNYYVYDKVIRSIREVLGKYKR